MALAFIIHYKKTKFGDKQKASVVKFGDKIGDKKALSATSDK